jgi:hypothetical protein
MSVDPTNACRRSGEESFAIGEPISGLRLLNFWRWYASDLVSNATRGVLAEFSVASALGVADGVRVEWDAFDIRTRTGIRVEVKSAAYCQSWQQNRLSDICFGIAPTLGWDASTNTSGSELARQSDVYVFCVLHHLGKATLGSA